MSATPNNSWRDHPRLPEAGLLLATFVWGASYFGTKIAMGLADPLFYVGVRFAVAAILLALLCRDALKQVGPVEWLAAAAVGGPMAVAYVLQAAGLQQIESSKSAFITAMHVPMVPILQLIVMRLVPRRMTWVGAVLCLVGLVLLAGPETLVSSWESGEVLTVFSTVAIAVEIVMIGVFAPRVNIPAVAVLQLACVAIAALVAMPILGEEMPATVLPLFWQVTILMAIAVALMQVLMNWAQQTVSPTRAALIYSSEPVWAGIIGWFVGERLGVVALVGCGMILLGVLVSEWRPGDRSRTSASEC